MASISRLSNGEAPTIGLVVGTHYIVEFLRCDPAKLARVEAVRPILTRAVEDCGSTALDFAWHQFEPEGVSATVLIAESHFCIHSWPEHAYMSCDIFTCGVEMDAELAVSILADGIGADETILRVLERGIPG